MYFQIIESPDDRTKFEKLYTTYLKKMQYVAESILKDSNEAENVVHDTFLAIIDNLGNINENDCHKTWNYIVTILKNKCFNVLQKNKKTVYSDDSLVFKDQEQSSNEEIVIKKELTEFLITLIRTMNYPYKEVIYLRYYNGMNLKEIAEVLQISYDNTRQIFVRAKKLLKQKCIEGGYEYDGSEF